MSNASLYLVQSDFAATPAALAKLQQLYQTSDCVVLMGEAAFTCATYSAYSKSIACMF